MNKPKKTLETFTLVLHVSMKTFAFASARTGLLMNITYSFLENRHAWLRPLTLMVAHLFVVILLKNL